MANKHRKTPGWKILLLMAAATLSMVVVFMIYNWWTERKARFVHYPAFGIDIPVNYAIHGIDVSKYQGLIDWSAVKEMKVGHVQIGFVFIKATEGLGNEDALFERNWKKAGSAGLVRGAYHFFLATKSGKLQADNFIHSVSIRPGDLPPVLDIEQAYGVAPDKLRERAMEWMETVGQYYHVTPIIYTNVEFYRKYLQDDFDRYPLWVAHYLQMERPRIYRDWHFWQHNEAGSVEGISTRVDFDVFNGDSVEFRKMLIGAPSP